MQNPDHVERERTPVPANAFAHHLRCAVSIALASDFPLPFGDQLQQAVDAVYREARNVH